jgi:hypothetical protein
VFDIFAHSFLYRGQLNLSWIITPGDYAILPAIAFNVAGLQAADGGQLHEFNVSEGMATRSAGGDG